MKKIIYFFVFMLLTVSVVASGGGDIGFLPFFKQENGNGNFIKSSIFNLQQGKEFNWKPNSFIKNEDIPVETISLVSNKNVKNLIFYLQPLEKDGQDTYKKFEIKTNFEKEDIGSVKVDFSVEKDWYEKNRYVDIGIYKDGQLQPKTLVKSQGSNLIYRIQIDSFSEFKIDGLRDFVQEEETVVALKEDRTPGSYEEAVQIKEERQAAENLITGQATTEVPVNKLSGLWTGIFILFIASCFVGYYGYKKAKTKTQEKQQ